MARKKRGRGGNRYDDSLCWHCIHAYADDNCFKTPLEERTWVRKKKGRKVKVYRGKLANGTICKKEITLWKVLECERFKRGRKHVNADWNLLYRSPLWGVILNKKLSKLAK